MQMLAQLIVWDISAKFGQCGSVHPKECRDIRESVGQPQHLKSDQIVLQLLPAASHLLASEDVLALLRSFRKVQVPSGIWKQLDTKNSSPSRVTIPACLQRFMMSTGKPH
jgi:hypothetical protein